MVVKWPHISNARVIVECGLENYRVDPSQGTHFFQNPTSFGVGYFTVNPFMGDGWFDEAFLNAQPAVEETEYLRHVRFDAPITIKHFSVHRWSLPDLWSQKMACGKYFPSLNGLFSD